MEKVAQPSLYDKANAAPYDVDLQDSVVAMRKLLNKINARLLLCGGKYRHFNDTRFKNDQ